MSMHAICWIVSNHRQCQACSTWNAPLVTNAPDWSTQSWRRTWLFPGYCECTGEICSITTHVVSVVQPAVLLLLACQQSTGCCNPSHQPAQHAMLLFLVLLLLSLPLPRPMHAGHLLHRGHLAALKQIHHTFMQPLPPGAAAVHCQWDYVAVAAPVAASPVSVTWHHASAFAVPAVDARSCRHSTHNMA